MKIGIIGLNKVGLCFGLLCQESGYDVFGSDNNQKIIYELENKIFNSFDINTRKLLLQNKSFNFIQSIEEVIVNCEIIFVFTTPKDNIFGK